MTVSAAEAVAYRTGAGTAQRTAWLAGVLADRLPPGGIRLELGQGGLAPLIGAVCVEAEPHLWAIAEGPVIGARPDQLPLRSGCVDAIVASAMRPLGSAGVFVEVARVLRPSGVMVCALPAPDAPVADPIGKILAPMRAELRPMSRAAARDRLVADAAAAGLRTGCERLPAYAYEQAPAREAGDLRNRASSILWGVDDETYRRVVEPAIAALLALPDPETPITRHALWDVLTITRG